MKRINKIVVPIDFSEISERVIETALIFAEQFGAELSVIFVVQDINTALSGFAMVELPIVQMEGEILDSAEKRMGDFLEKHCPGSALSVRSKVLQGQAAEEIIEWSKTYDADLIVMGTHGYRGFEKMIMGSVTDRVLKLAACPVLTTR
jgi:nucleotide-binding universal stress UspA family protein